MPQQPWLQYPAVGLAAFLALWTGICLLLSATGGWRRLAGQYSATGMTSFNKWHWQGCRVGWVGYNGCVTFGANFNGIYMALWLMFRPGHPPLEIPYTDIRGTHRKGILFDYVDLEFTRCPGITVTVLQRCADRFVHESGGNWRYQSIDD